jgi:glycerophosphoryl diester phosphodiesterase
MLIIGHRGAAAHLLENTMPSFHKALELGADGFEMDVRITGDGKLVVFHNSVVGGHAVQTSNYEDIRQLPDGYEIPLFEDFLTTFGRRAFLDIELKSPGFEEEALRLIQKHCDLTRTILSAFHPPTLLKVRQLAPDLPLGYIFNRTQEEEGRHNCPIEYVIPQFRLASRDLINQVHGEGLKVFAWTVNDAQEATRLMDLGIDGLISDYPEMLVQLVQSRQ